jgi:hypothetical protein
MNIYRTLYTWMPRLANWFGTSLSVLFVVFLVVMSIVEFGWWSLAIPVAIAAFWLLAYLGDEAWQYIGRKAEESEP